MGFYELILSTNTTVQALLLVSSGALVKTGWGKILPNWKVVVLCMRCAWGKNGDPLHKAKGNRQIGIRLSLGLCSWL